jgi:TRAP-type C4-dicarboxylate transport system permease small subunit
VSTALETIDRAIGAACKWGVIGALLGLFFLLLLGVIVRLVPVLPISGYDEIVELLVVWMTMVGAVALWREGGLYRVVVIEEMMPSPMRRALTFVHHLLMLFFALVLLVKGLEFVRDAGETTPFLGIDKTYWYLALPIPGALMAAYSVVHLVRTVRGRRTLSDGGSIVA